MKSSGSRPLVLVLLAVCFAEAASLVGLWVRSSGQQQQQASVNDQERDNAARSREEAEAQRRLAEANARRADAEAGRARRTLATAQLVRAAPLAVRQPDQAVAILDDDAVFPPGERDFAWAWYRRLCHRERLVLNTGRSELGGRNTVHHPLALSPDGRLLAAEFVLPRPETPGDRPKPEVRLLDPKTGQVLSVLPTEGEVSALVFGPDGKYLAVKEKKRIRLRNLATGKETTSPGEPEFGDTSRTLAFSPDGGQLAAAWEGLGDTVVVWSMPSFEVRARIKPAGEDIPGGLTCLAFRPDGKVMALGAGSAGGRSGSVVLWDLDAGKAVLRVTDFGDLVLGLAFSPDGKTLAVACVNPMLGEGQLQLRDAVTGRLLGRLLEPRRAAPNGVLCVAFSPDGRLLASGGVDDTVRLWDGRTGQERCVLRGPGRGRMHAVAFGPGGRTLVVGCGDGTLRVWDLSADPEGQLLQDGPEHGFRKGFSDWVTRGLSFSRDGRYLAAGGIVSRNRDRSEGGAVVWDAATGRRRAVLRCPEEFVDLVALSPDGAMLAGNCGGGTIRLWEVVDGKVRHNLDGKRSIRAVLFSPDGRTLASAGGDGAVRLWDPVEGKETGRLQVSKSSVTAIDFSPDGRTLAAGTDDEVQLWDVAEAQVRHTLRGHRSSVKTVAFSPDGKRLAVGTSPRFAETVGELRLWDLDRLAPLWIVPEPAGFVASVAFTPNGRTLAAGIETTDNRGNWLPGLVRLLDPVTGQQRGVLEHTDQVLAVAFSPDGTTLATVNGNPNVPGEVRLFRTAGGDERPP